MLIDELTAFYSKETFFEDHCKQTCKPPKDRAFPETCAVPKAPTFEKSQDTRALPKSCNLPKGLLHNSCKHATKCWERVSLEDKEASSWNYFSIPYIGDEYKGELVCVGLNVHKGGGRNIQELCIKGYNGIDKNKLHKNDINADRYDPGVIQTLSEGRKNVQYEIGMEKHGIPYPGTPLFHRIAVYSKIIMDGYQPNIENDSKELVDAYKRIIFMDVIKCSPGNNQSTPTSAMLERCPGYIFFNELEIIKPKNILIMTKKVAKLMREHYPSNSKEFPQNKKTFDHCQMDISGKKTNVFYIIHPLAHGGPSLSLIPEFGDFVKQKVK